MKRNVLLFTIVLGFGGGQLHPLHGQVSGFGAPARRNAAVGLAPSRLEQSPSGQYSAQDLEALRSELLNLADSVQEFAALAPSDLVDASSLADARVQIQQMSPRYLNSLRQGIS